MKIELDNIEEKDMFEALLDGFISMSEIDEVEENFINRLYKSIQVTKEKNNGM